MIDTEKEHAFSKEEIPKKNRKVAYNIKSNIPCLLEEAFVSPDVTMRWPNVNVDDTNPSENLRTIFTLVCMSMWLPAVETITPTP